VVPSVWQRTAIRLLGGARNRIEASFMDRL